MEEEFGKDMFGDVWFMKYMFVNIKCEFGDYDEVIELYCGVMKIYLGEEGVILVLM